MSRKKAKGIVLDFLQKQLRPSLILALTEHSIKEYEKDFALKNLGKVPSDKEKSFLFF